MKPKKSITFFFPYYDVSGCPVLFLNIALKIEKLYSNDYQLYLVDYCDGYMASHLPKETTVEIIPFEDRMPCVVDTDYLIMQAYLAPAIRPELKISDSTKVLFWMLYPMNFLPVVFPFNFFPNFIEYKLNLYSRILNLFYKGEFKKARENVLYLLNSNSIAFMNRSDLPAVRTMLRLDHIEPNFIPIASSDPNNIKKFQHSDNILRFGWVGRLCGFKINILNFVLNNFYESANLHKRKIEFHVIGTGECEDILFRKESDFFTIIKVGSLPKDALDNYLLDNIDINFAMGTSVIESAKLGIPSVKLDFSTGDIPKTYVPEWFHDSKGFDVGHAIGEEDLDIEGRSFDKFISDFDSDKVLLSSKAKEHYEKYFSLNMVSSMLLEQLETITSSWGDMPTYLKRPDFARMIYYKLKYKI